MSPPELALTTDEDDDDLGLTAKQLSALERLAELGAAPAEPHPDKPGKMLYSSNPQIRALQLVFEGRFGGAGRGQGRPKPAKRAAEVLAEEIRKAPHVKKMYKALERGLRKDAGPRVNLDAIKLSVEIERGERALQIKEEEHEDNLGTKEELIAELIEALTEPEAIAALQGFAEEDDEEITDAIVVEAQENSSQASDAAGNSVALASTRTETVGDGKAGDNRATARPKKTGNNGRSSGTNDRKGTARPNSKGKKSSVKSSNRRTPK